MIVSMSGFVAHRRAAPARRAVVCRSTVDPRAWLATLLRALHLRGSAVGSFEHVDGGDLEDGGFRASDSMGLGVPLLRAFADTMPTYGRHHACHRSSPRTLRA